VKGASGLSFSERMDAGGGQVFRVDLTEFVVIQGFRVVVDVKRFVLIGRVGAGRAALPGREADFQILLLQETQHNGTVPAGDGATGTYPRLFRG